MLIEHDNWTVERLVRDQGSINLNPAWQRGPAWKEPRQVLLIDSILRGMDIPKVYLRRLLDGGIHRHDAVDGQQRLRAIWEFRADEFPLTYPDALPAVGRFAVADLHYSELHRSLRQRFDSFTVTIAEIVQATGDEITSLFSRLQMGVSLNPAELRNALGGPMRHVIDALATSHQFFENSRIPSNRYKRQDYATHAFAMAAYRGQRDIKAPDLRALVLDYGAAQADRVLEMSVEVGDALNVLAEVNELSGHRITQKWIFVDLCWLVMTHQAEGAVVDSAQLAAAYQHFEAQRRRYLPNPDILIRRGRRNASLDRHLYNYINAFRLQGGLASNIRLRAAALRAFCPNIDRRS